MMSKSEEGSSPIPFLYEDQHLVRVINRDDDLWFAAKDICERLGFSNVGAAIQGLDPDERSSTMLMTSGGQQEMALISEPGLYKLLSRSRKPEARAFDRFVRHVILPTIRKTGAFGSLPHDPRAVGEFNAASRLLGELRRTLGIREAAKATPGVLAKIGLPPLEAANAEIFRQGELNLPDNPDPTTPH
jgi:prophage antirepressor-like protein